MSTDAIEKNYNIELQYVLSKELYYKEIERFRWLHGRVMMLFISSSIAAYFIAIITSYLLSLNINHYSLFIGILTSLLCIFLYYLTIIVYPKKTLTALDTEFLLESKLDQNIISKQKIVEHFNGCLKNVFDENEKLAKKIKNILVLSAFYFVIVISFISVILK